MTFPITERLPIEFDNALPQSVDCVIVGGGVIGLATAYELRRRGREVLVVDAGTVDGRIASDHDPIWVRCLLANGER